MAQNLELLGNFLPPGTKVRYGGGEYGPEYGIVVHCWIDQEYYVYDCYVAFFGDAFPTDAPKALPYILRYAAVSLDVVS